ncbi:potassium/proton antiporter [Candidatus Saccharibacteria bacterium]|nr:potassium/proton antiporter [Candidatus Saccharibacteria bacterium]NCU40686.1 potassium/proton antiporter [Candidatus Saccharibacteria bacterium]
MEEAQILVLVGCILAASLLVAFGASRLGVPSLVAFLLLGMLIGIDGPGNVDFSDAQLARTIAIIGLVAILFEGGLSTSWRRLREVAVPAALLSTVAVLVTAFMAGLAAYILFDVPILYAFLIGAIISSTDAAAVFAALRNSRVKRKLGRTLEAESGANDPVAIALTVGIVSWITEPGYGLDDMVILLLHKLIVGLLIGLVLGILARLVFSRLPISIGSFAPVASLAICTISFGLTELVGGSGFLAVYLVGLAIGSTPSRYRSMLTAFHEGLAFLAQVIMFIVLGLLVVPSQLFTVAGTGIVLSILLMFIIRPIAVWLSTIGSGFQLNEKMFLGWAGLRGALPIILATIVISSGIEYSNLIFNIVFFVVLISTIFQGSTLEYVASKLKVIDVMPVAEIHHSQRRILSTKFFVMPSHAIVGSYINELGLPPKAYIKAIRRGPKEIRLTSSTKIRSDDYVIVSYPATIQPELEDVMIRWRRRI